MSNMSSFISKEHLLKMYENGMNVIKKYNISNSAALSYHVNVNNIINKTFCTFNKMHCGDKNPHTNDICKDCRRACWVASDAYDYITRVVQRHIQALQMEEANREEKLPKIVLEIQNSTLAIAEPIMESAYKLPLIYQIRLDMATNTLNFIQENKLKYTLVPCNSSCAYVVNNTPKHLNICSFVQDRAANWILINALDKIIRYFDHRSIDQNHLSQNTTANIEKFVKVANLTKNDLATLSSFSYEENVMIRKIIDVCSSTLFTGPERILKDDVPVLIICQDICKNAGALYFVKEYYNAEDAIGEFSFRQIYDMIEKSCESSITT